MAICKDCVHNNICNKKQRYNHPKYALQHIEKYCEHFKDRSRFVELKSAEWIEDEDMYGDPIFRCSNCEARFVLVEGTPEDNDYCYCPTCGAKIQKIERHRTPPGQLSPEPGHAAEPGHAFEPPGNID